jgi:Family of unknown function (DUF6361)
MGDDQLAATLTWLDHDTTDRERMNRILALFRERDTRDELGIGVIRDLIADELFPGTSTIQTRLRYMLFVPWIYQRLEQKQRDKKTFAEEARRLEVAIVKALMASGDDTAGVFGKRTGGGLKRLPSSVYWAGLGMWQIRRFQGSQDQYHTAIENIYSLRSTRKRSEESARRRGEGHDAIHEDAAITWHPKLPEAPHGFPEEAGIHLLRDEAQFIQDQILTTHPKSLLAQVILLPLPSVGFPWEHPDLVRFTAAHRELLHHARLLSEIAYGAAILYNLMLAELQGSTELEEARRNDAKDWLQSLDRAGLRRWSLGWVTPLAFAHEQVVSPQTLEFCQKWLGMICSLGDSLFDDSAARVLIRAREIRLKGGRSRFTNPRALDQWRGKAGLFRLNYRWPTATQFASDLQEGMAGNGNA